MSNAQHILDNCDLLVKADCKIVDDVVYERCKFVDPLFTKSEFVNTDTETYYLNDDDHVYRFFITDDDYDYVTDAETVSKLNDLFK